MWKEPCKQVLVRGDNYQLARYIIPIYQPRQAGGDPAKIWVFITCSYAPAALVIGTHCRYFAPVMVVMETN
ncbi:hypothetical protein M405DRAFT_31190 [Rhizopogon salebrosus TDB-379]|nr:hypothetical protein M405DRAFT_31190 [Rhizopogon salebrosus TDB-379]